MLIVPMSCFTSIFFFSLFFPLILAAADTISPSCPDRCGNVSIPYPFGIGAGCSKDRSFQVTCRNNGTSSKPYIGGLLAMDEFELISISLPLSQARIYFNRAYLCQEKSRELIGNSNQFDLDLGNTSYRVSGASNKLITIGCATLAYMIGNNGSSNQAAANFTASCVSVCATSNDMTPGQPCTGMGCCQVSVPEGIQRYLVHLVLLSANDSDIRSISPCNYAVMTDEELVMLNQSELADVNWGKNKRVTMMLDWAFRDHQTCSLAAEEPQSYACSSPYSECIDAANGPGYTCNCSSGFQGNPYLPNGCRDINECQYTDFYKCYGVCTNSIGSYSCSCPVNTIGDPNVLGGCISIISSSYKRVVIITSISVPVGSIFLAAFSSSVWRMIKQRNKRRRKGKYYKKNLDLLREEQYSSNAALIEKMIIYDLDDLEKATNNFDKTRIIGGGGHGNVYKGILSDQRVVAVKKPKITSKEELRQFINEVFILSQTNHRNVVKFFGCCLQAEIPLLVFEFVSGGTLHDHLVDNQQQFTRLTFKNRLNIATEVARALSYLHSEASVTIYHRDIKSSNILLDERGIAKVADFGASRFVPVDQDSVTTMVQGTYGYLDPEYHQTRRLTNKSDVYSFGVILVELLTSRMAIPPRKDTTHRYLLMDFLESMRENSVHEVVDIHVLNEAKAEEIEGIARLAEACLHLKGNLRPTMKEVEDELEAIRSGKRKDVASINRWDKSRSLDKIYKHDGEFLGSASSYEVTRSYSFELELQFSGKKPR